MTIAPLTLSGRTTPYCILITALGGEGGGVLMNWIVAAARQVGLAVQATSVPGVAQRTGSTSYYIELLPAPAAGQKAPVFALVPMPGRVDVLIASEAVEAGRMMERGFVSPTRTILIMSTSRVYATAEKIDMGDGRFAPERVLAAAAKLAQRTIAIDLDALARANGTMVSATMFGALAGAGTLAWSRETSEAMIGDGRSASASRAGFNAAFDAATTQRSSQGFSPGPMAPQTSSRASGEMGPRHVVAKHAGHDAEDDSAGHVLPAFLAAVAQLGIDRTTEFQDAAYGQLYQQRLATLIAAAGPALETPQIMHALEEAARRLALWMAYEDVPRVAFLKTRPERFARIRSEAQAKPGEVVRVIDYLKPGAEEVAAMLPASLGRRLMRRALQGKYLPFIGKGLHLSSTTISGNLSLRLLAQGRRWRRSSMRFAAEQTAIEAWLAAMHDALARDAGYASALAELPRLLKGYSDTQARGQRNYSAILDCLVHPQLTGASLGEATPVLRRAIAAALADPNAKALDELLAGRAR